MTMQSMKRVSRCAPSLLGNGSVVIDEELTARVRRFVATHGVGKARRMRNVSDGAIDAARDRGRMKPETRDKIVAALDGFDAAADASGGAS